MKLIKNIIGYILLIFALFVLGIIFPIMFVFYIIWVGLYLTGKLN